MVHAPGRKGKRPRILYWFRTPPGVRVGRGPLDEEAIRLIEAGNPEVEFNWTRILKGQGAAEPPAADRRDPRRDQRQGRPTVEVERRPPPSSAPPPISEPAPPIEQTAEPTTPAHARLGSEGLARLRARYSETLARITERVPEADKQDELKALAERLNPDAWVTESEVTAGLESYEATFASLRAALGRGRKPEQPETSV